VDNAERYGVVSFDGKGDAVGIEEKPACVKSGWTVTGLQFYGKSGVEIVSSLRALACCEVEIADVSCAYLQSGLVQVEKL
jgi:glucose-1-phosphate thymidylyltransferase